MGITSSKQIPTHEVNGFQTLIWQYVSDFLKELESFQLFEFKNGKFEIRVFLSLRWSQLNAILGNEYTKFTEKYLSGVNSASMFPQLEELSKFMQLQKFVVLTIVDILNSDCRQDYQGLVESFIVQYKKDIEDNVGFPSEASLVTDLLARNDSFLNKFSQVVDAAGCAPHLIRARVNSFKSIIISQVKSCVQEATRAAVHEIAASLRRVMDLKVCDAIVHDNFSGSDDISIKEFISDLFQFQERGVGLIESLPISEVSGIKVDAIDKFSADIDRIVRQIHIINSGDRSKLASLAIALSNHATEEPADLFVEKKKKRKGKKVVDSLAIKVDEDSSLSDLATKRRKTGKKSRA